MLEVNGASRRLSTVRSVVSGRVSVTAPVLSRMVVSHESRLKGEADEQDADHALVLLVASKEVISWWQGRSK